MDKLTLEDSFRELIKQRKWYVNSLRSPIQAKYDKATFQKGGKVPEERIRDYLAAAGWKCVQPELWEERSTGIVLTSRIRYWKHDRISAKGESSKGS